VKTLIIILNFWLVSATFAQGGGGMTGGTIGPKPTDDTRVLIEILRDRASNPLLNNSGGGGFGGGVPPRPRPTTGDSTHTRTITLGGHSVTVDQRELDALKTDGLRNNKREEVLPTRLHIESINLSSDEVSEITLKDGSVVKVEDLQEFVREKMKSKLNQ
jgi:hypothetical protein